MAYLKSIAVVLVTIGVVGCDSVEPSTYWREKIDPNFGVGTLKSIVPFDSLHFPEPAESRCRHSKIEASHYPLSPGNRWTYVHVENQGDSLEYDWDGVLNRDVYSKAGVLDTGISVFPVATYYPLQEAISYFELYDRDDEGLHAFGGQPENDTLFESSIKYPYPAVLGDSSEVVIRRYVPDLSSSSSGSWKEIRGLRDVIAVDSMISTPAGDFLSTVYRTKGPATRDHPSQYLFEYVSEGVGLVAWSASYSKTPIYGTKWLLADYCLVIEY